MSNTIAKITSDSLKEISLLARIENAIHKSHCGVFIIETAKLLSKQGYESIKLPVMDGFIKFRYLQQDEPNRASPFIIILKIVLDNKESKELLLEFLE